MRKILACLLGLCMWTACEYETIVPEKVVLPDEDTPILFSTQIEPFFVAKCNTCHAAQSPILTQGKVFGSLNTGGYLNTADPAQSVVYTKTKGGHPGGSNSLSATELALLLRWIEEGAKNN